MKLVASAVHPIASEVVQRLVADGSIEIERKRSADAEQDLSGIMREYLTGEEEVVTATRHALARRGLDETSFSSVQQEMADVRGFRLGDAGIRHVVAQLADSLLVSRHVEEVFASDEALRQQILGVMQKHLASDAATSPPR
jgi:uncharacterized protein